MLVHDRRGVRYLRRAGHLLTDHSRERRQRLTGIALMCGAVACFACLDATAKYLNHHMDTLQVVWARYTSAFILALVIYQSAVAARSDANLPAGAADWALGAAARLDHLRISSRFRYLQLDQALAIMFSTPFIVAALAGPMLGEWVGWRRWTAIMVGFAGVLLVTRPGRRWRAYRGRALRWLSAVCYAIYIDLDPPADAHRFERDHAVLFQSRRRARHDAGLAVCMVDAGKRLHRRPDDRYRSLRRSSGIIF